MNNIGRTIVDDTSELTQNNSVGRMGAFSKRRNPIPDETQENDAVMHSDETPSTVDSDSLKSASPLHTQTDSSAILSYHERMEIDAARQFSQNRQLLLPKLVEISPRGRLTLVRMH